MRQTPDFLKAEPRRTRRSAVALSVAHLDTHADRGQPAHLRAFAAAGATPRVVTTAVAAALAHDVDRDIAPLPARVLRAQLGAAFAEPPDATLLGLLGGEENIRTTAELLAGQALRQCIWDPDMIAVSDGAPLLKPDSLEAARTYLLPLLDLLSPNTFEAALLIDRPVWDVGDMREACRRLVDRGASAVLITGGKLEGHAIDLYFDGSGFVEFGHDRIKAPRILGAGATLRGLIAAQLARGASHLAAIEAAKDHTTQAISRAERLRDGSLRVDPMRRHYRDLHIEPEPHDVDDPDPSEDLDYVLV